jgi:predicted transcriptional regulator
MTSQDVPISIRLRLDPEDQRRLADLAERLGLGEQQILIDALAAYAEQLDLAVQLRTTSLADELERLNVDVNSPGSEST